MVDSTQIVLVIVGITVFLFVSIVILDAVIGSAGNPISSALYEFFASITGIFST